MSPTASAYKQLRGKITAVCGIRTRARGDVKVNRSMTRNAEVVNYKNREVSRAEIASEPATDRDEKLTRELCR
jgi:hypothetical protein